MEVLHDLRVVLDLCLELGIVVNPKKSNFVPSQKVLLSGDCSRLPNFGGFSIPGSNRRAAVSRRRISILHSAASRLLAVSAGHSVFSHPSSAGPRPWVGELI